MRWSAQQLAAYQSRRGDTDTVSTTGKQSAARLGPTELQVHIAVAEHLRRRAVPGLVWWHTPNGELCDKVAAAKLKVMGVLPGVPDLMLLHDGKTYGLELKTDAGRLSAKQRAVLAAFDAAGAFTAVGYGLDSALAILEAWGLLRTSEQRERNDTSKTET